MRCAQRGWICSGKWALVELSCGTDVQQEVTYTGLFVCLARRFLRCVAVRVLSTAACRLSLACLSCWCGGELTGERE